MSNVETQSDVEAQSEPEVHVGPLGLGVQPAAAETQRPTRVGRTRVIMGALFCTICVSLNTISAQLATIFHLPLYLDTIGTIIAGAFGGYVPGVVVGYFTNIVNSSFDVSSLYYSVINVLIGLFAAWCANRKWFRRPHTFLLSILGFSLIGGILGSCLSLWLYGFGFGDSITAPFVRYLYAEVGLGPQISQLVGDYIVDLLDKSFCTCIAIIVVRLIQSAGDIGLDFSPWQQTPLPDETREQLRNVKSRIMSLRSKVAVIVGTIMIVLVCVTTWISYSMFNTSMLEEQASHALSITELAKSHIDPDRVDDFLTLGEDAEDFLETESQLAEIRDTFPGVEYIYAYRIMEDGCHVVLDPDTADVPGSDPGDVIPFDNAFLDYRDDLLAGRTIEPVISNETYGWLLTAYSPLYNNRGECVCYVATDLLMDEIVHEGHSFLARIISLFVAFFVLMCVIVLWLAEYGVILPLNTIAHATAGFAYGIRERRYETMRNVELLDVHTGDEVENLYKAVVKTVDDTVLYLSESEEKTETIARMQTNLIMVMADLVESRDKFTGDHIRKTAAYVAITMEEMVAEGIYADQLTDEFISDVNSSAPLHDIGKILVSDTILNKPGRLTPEEFKLMQAHTTAGREILERAVDAVSDPMYLDEAKRIAEFHHEKWDGTGYPSGLAGEDIPLSARIMAVADVFDALVSKRSYKNGFPLEKAFAIIEEGVGTHFDPLIATAFLNARDKAAAVARAYGDVTDE